MIYWYLSDYHSVDPQCHYWQKPTIIFEQKKKKWENLLIMTTQKLIVILLYAYLFTKQQPKVKNKNKTISKLAAALYSAFLWKYLARRNSGESCIRELIFFLCVLLLLLLLLIVGNPAGSAIRSKSPASRLGVQCVHVCVYCVPSTHGSDGWPEQKREREGGSETVMTVESR